MKAREARVLKETKESIISLYSLFKKFKIYKNDNNSIEYYNYNTSRPKIKTYRNSDKLPRQRSASTIFSRKLNFRNESEINKLKLVKKNTNLDFL